MNVLIFGATSTIAEALAREFAGAGDALVLLARDRERLATVATDLTARGASAVVEIPFDATDTEALEATVERAWTAHKHVDVAVICYGTLTDQDKAESDPVYAARELQINASSIIVLLAALGRRFAQRKGGTLAVIGSVAGDRGRPSNYVYGAAKASVASCAEGLRAKLFADNVAVLTIKPGFVRTAMTADLTLPEALVAEPERVAGDIHRAIVRGKSGVLYTPWFWRWIMAIIRAIPNVIFKRLSL